METRHYFHGEDNLKTRIDEKTQSDVKHHFDKDVTDARERCLSGSNMAVNQNFFGVMGYGPVGLSMFYQS